MPRSMLRMFTIVTQLRGKLIVSQFLLAVSALATIGCASMTQSLINDGMNAGDADPEVWQATRRISTSRAVRWSRGP